MITAPTASTSSIHKDTINTQTKCGKCGYNHTEDMYPAYGRDCYNCGKKGHFTSLYRRPRMQVLRMNSTLNVKEVNLEQDHTADTGTTAMLGTGQTAEGTKCRGGRGHSSDISISGDCYRSPIRDHYRSPSRSNRCSSAPYHALPPRQPQHTKHW